MGASSRILTFVVGFVTLFPFRLIAQDGSGWRISPEKISIKVGQDRHLQLLDDLAQELHDAVWSIDDFTLVEIQEEDGRAVAHAKAVGTVRVSATLGRQTSPIEIKIWPEPEPLPTGTTNWAVHPIGREIGDLPAVPTADGPQLFSLEQTASGGSYLRASGEDGIQIWAWLMPEKTLNMELVCGDWLGGALVSANRADAFTIYAVGKDGKARSPATVSSPRRLLSRDDNLVLWQLHPDGTYRTTTIEVSNTLSGSVAMQVPTGAIIPDGTDGLLLSVRMSRDLHTHRS